MSSATFFNGILPSEIRFTKVQADNTDLFQTTLIPAEQFDFPHLVFPISYRIADGNNLDTFRFQMRIMTKDLVTNAYDKTVSSFDLLSRTIPSVGSVHFQHEMPYNFAYELQDNGPTKTKPTFIVAPGQQVELEWSRQSGSSTASFRGVFAYVKLRDMLVPEGSDNISGINF